MIRAAMTISLALFFMPGTAGTAFAAASADAPGQVPIVRSLLIILVSAAVVSILVRRLRLVGIPVYLLTGAVIGPHAARLVRSPENLAEISHFAIILLLFGIGLDVHLSALKKGAARLIAVGFGSCAVTVFVGWPVVELWGLPGPVALAVAMALSLSSTAVVMRIFAEKRRLRSAGGRMALAILVIQDLLVLVMLAALPAIATWAAARGELPPSELMPWNGQGIGPALAQAALRLAGIAALVLAARFGLPRLLRESAKGRAVDALLIVGTACALGTAYATQALGFSLEMGAFLAGFILSTTPFKHQLMGQIGPLRDLFMAVFFTAIGMQLDPGVIAEWWWAIMLGGGVLMAIKWLIIGSSCWALGATAGVAASVGLCLAQAGEFSLVLLESARVEGILGPETASVVIAVIVISIMLTPLLARVAFGLESRLVKIGGAPWVKSQSLRDVPGETKSREIPIGEAGPDSSGRRVRYAIIGGFGPVGQRIAKTLESGGVAYTVVELNASTVRRIGKEGGRAVYGDVANASVLESAQISRADALLLTVPDDNSVLRACTVARKLAPEIFISARVSMVYNKSAAEEAGADLVVVEELTAAEAMTQACAIKLDED
jgi:CPA2 family monovalent cation:H+ antiporter-2